MEIEEKEEESLKEIWFHLLVGVLGLFAMGLFMYALIYSIGDFLNPTSFSSNPAFIGVQINSPTVTKLEHWIFNILMLIGGLSLVNSLREINISKFKFLKKKI